MSFPAQSSVSAAAFPLLYEAALHTSYFSSKSTQPKCLLWQEVKSPSPHFSCTRFHGWRVTGLGEVMRCSVQILLAAETKITALSLYWKGTQGKKLFLLKLMGCCFSKFKEFNPKLIAEKRIYIQWKKIINEAKYLIFLDYLNAKLLTGGPCPKEEPILVWRAFLGWLTEQCNSLSYNDITHRLGSIP